MLFSLYVEEINMSLGKDKTDKNAEDYRTKLRTFLLEPNKLNLRDTYAALKRYRHFATELTLLDGIQVICLF